MEETTIIKTESEQETAEEFFDADEAIEAKIDSELLREMMNVGLMFGHKKSKTNPKFKKYIFITRNGVEIIDLIKTIEFIEKAAEFLKSQIKEGKMILLVATQPAANLVMESLAGKFNLPYVKNRWVGGLITNFKVISQRIEFFKKTKADMESGEFNKYTKKERVVINKNIDRMKKIFEGLEKLTKMPDALFVIDASIKGHATAIREARLKNIPIVAIIDSDDNPEFINYFIPANDHAKDSIEWVINRIDKQLTAV
ncbi:MAG: 30S ribosomal protein S2 [Patescibacteria group bacterium]